MTDTIVQPIQEATKPDNWQLGYYIATWLIALIAVAGFWTSIKSSRKISKSLNQYAFSLKSIQSELTNVTTPLVKFVDYYWLPVLTEGETFSCSKLPIGLAVIYRNVSNVAIKILDIEFDIFFGDKKFDAPVRTIGASDNCTFLMAPNEPKVCIQTNAEQLGKYLPQAKASFKDPVLSFHLKLKYKVYDSQKVYEYDGKYKIDFDCNSPELKGWHAVDEDVRLIHEN